MSTTHVFLMDGFNETHDHQFGNNERYEHISATYGGYIGIVSMMERMALGFDDYLKRYEAERPNLNYPGVLEYEIVESLGWWIFDALGSRSDCIITSDEYEEQIKCMLDLWFSIGSDDPQPKEREMTVAELIRQLQSLPQDLPVLTRGSEPQKMVDVVEVRQVSTTKRTAVFIGKPKATTAG